jgi:hypothetical protein
VLGQELVPDPEGHFAVGAVTQEKEEAVGELAPGTGPGGQAEAIVLGEQGGSEAEDQREWCYAPGGVGRDWRLRSLWYDKSSFVLVSGRRWGFTPGAACTSKDHTR